MDAEAIAVLPPSLLWPLVVGIFIFALFALLKGIESGVMIWRATRKTPPVEEVIAQLATKGDVSGIETRLERKLKETEQRLGKRIDEVDVRYAEEIRRMRSYNSKTTSEIFDLIRNTNVLLTQKIDTLDDSMEAELRNIAKEIGQLQGHQHRQHL